MRPSTRQESPEPDINLIQVKSEPVVQRPILVEDVEKVKREETLVKKKKRIPRKQLFEFVHNVETD